MTTEELISLGWQLVPPNPTKEMILAILGELEVSPSGGIYGVTLAWREALKHAANIAPAEWRKEYENQSS